MFECKARSEVTFLFKISVGYRLDLSIALPDQEQGCSLLEEGTALLLLVGTRLPGIWLTKPPVSYLAREHVGISFH